MKKAPETGALDWKLCLPTLPQGTPALLLLFCGCLFLRGCFLGCALHRLILPKHQNFAIRKSQCDSYIRLFVRKVKRKMHSRFVLPLSTCMIALLRSKDSAPS